MPRRVPGATSRIVWIISRPLLQGRMYRVCMYVCMHACGYICIVVTEVSDMTPGRRVYVCTAHLCHVHLHCNGGV